jgi:hypothetical protein
MTKLPKTVKVGTYTIDVKLTKGLMTDEENMGNFNGRTMEINIDPDMREDLQYGIFCHELIEAIKTIYDIEALVKDHHAITQLGEALHQILRENGKEILPE